MYPDSYRRKGKRSHRLTPWYYGPRESGGFFYRPTSVFRIAVSSQEYLFNEKGNLVFVFYEDFYNENVAHRVYFRDNALLQYSMGKEVIDAVRAEKETRLKWIIERGAKLRDFTFGVLMR